MQAEFNGLSTAIYRNEIATTIAANDIGENITQFKLYSHG